MTEVCALQVHSAQVLSACKHAWCAYFEAWA